MPLPVFDKKVQSAESPPAAVVACSPRGSGAGCADGFVAKQSPTTLRKIGTKKELNFHFFEYLSSNKISLLLQNIILNILQAQF